MIGWLAFAAALTLVALATGNVAVILAALVALGMSVA